MIPARNEAARIAPLLDAITGAPALLEVIVVDDESTDDTAANRRRRERPVVAAGALPEGWAGKSWALQCGLEAAQVEWIVTLDADTRPDAGAARQHCGRAGQSRTAPIC